MNDETLDFYVTVCRTLGQWFAERGVFDESEDFWTLIIMLRQKYPNLDWCNSITDGFKDMGL